MFDDFEDELQALNRRRGKYNRANSDIDNDANDDKGDTLLEICRGIYQTYEQNSKKYKYKCFGVC